MKRLLIGMLIGMMIGAPLAWAAARLTLQDGSGNEVGTTGNPLVVQTP